MVLLLFDASGRTYLWLRNNLLPLVAARSKSRLGGIAHIQQLDDGYLRLDLRMSSLRWKSGQHVIINVPAISLLQPHPFTISSVFNDDQTAVLIIKRRRGFTDRLWQRAGSSGMEPVRVTVSGPFGKPPCVSHDNNAVVLIATGNRASYTYALLLEILSAPNAIHTVHFSHIVSDRKALSWYAEHMSRAVQLASRARVRVTFSFHHTTTGMTDSHHEPSLDTGTTVFDIGDASSTSASRRQSLELRTFSPSSTSSASWSEACNGSTAPLGPTATHQQRAISRSPSSPNGGRANAVLDNADEAVLLPPAESSDILDSALPAPDKIVHSSVTVGRPSVDMLLRPAVADEAGRIAVVAAVPDALGAAISQAATQMSRELGLAWDKSTSVESLSLWLERHD